MTPATKIKRAREAAAGIDLGLWDAIGRLQNVGKVGTFAGIYADVTAFRSALADAATAIARAQEIVRSTDWPTKQDYDAA